MYQKSSFRTEATIFGETTIMAAEAITTQQQCANLIFSLRQNRETTAQLPATCQPATVPDAYAAQDLLVQQLLAAHSATHAGYKIGCTSKIAQEMLSVSEPFYGQLQSHDIYQTAAQLRSDHFRARVIEPEIGFRIGQTLPSTTTPYTAETIRPFIDAIFPTIEVVNPSYDNFGAVGAPALIADNAVWGVSVVGESITTWSEIDPAEVAVKLFVNDALVEEGVGANALGNPLNVVAWLANILQAHGKTLCAKMLISTGTTTNVYNAQAGDTLRAEYVGLGKVEVKFT